MNQGYALNLSPRKVKKVETEFRRICTDIPVPESLDIIEKHLKYEPLSMSDQLPAVWDRANGYQIYDEWGNMWLDFTSCYFVANAGHGNPYIADAIREMCDKPMLNSYYFFLKKRALLAEKLVGLAPDYMDKAFFLTTGAETTECALKLCRIHGRKINENKLGMLSFDGAFHGKTLGAQTMAGKPMAQKWIGKMDPYIYHLPCPTDPFESRNQIFDEEAGRKLFKKHINELEKSGVDLDSIAGCIMEPYQGWAALFYPIGYVKALREFLTEKNALFVSDEVQAGFGRTGKLFGYEYYDIKPDIICCGKAVSGALPLSAVLANREILDVDMTLNSTHGGSPVPVASALANLQFYEEHDLAYQAKKKEHIIKEKLEKMQAEFPDRIASVHGFGMAWAAVVVKPGTREVDCELVDRVIERAFEKGLMSIRTMTGTFKIGPPLITPEEALVEGMDVLIESMREIVSEGN